jgi:hypothetical protein
MPSKRYILVQGVPGKPVSDPWAQPGTSPLRFIGHELLQTPHPDPDGLIDHYQIRREVVLDHPDLRTAIADGDLIHLASTVARSHDDARTALLSPALPPTQPSKKAPPAGGDK